MDTSHFYVLQRIAESLDSDDVKGRLLALIDSHACHGDRSLVASQHLVDAELAALPDPSHPRGLSVHLHAADLDGRLKLYDDSGWDELPAQCPPGGLLFGERDRRWVACVEAAGEILDEEAILATSDEDLIDNMMHCIQEGQIATVPEHTSVTLLRLLGCGALTVLDVEAMLIAEEERLRQDVGMGKNKRVRKEERLAKVASQLGLISA